MHCFYCVLIPLCVVIPYLRKAFSPWAYVFPGVPEPAMAAANQLNAAPESHSHLTVSQHFHLAHLRLTKENPTATVQTVVTLDTQAFYNTTLSPSLSWLPGNELCYQTLPYK